MGYLIGKLIFQEISWEKTHPRLFFPPPTHIIYLMELHEKKHIYDKMSFFKIMEIDISFFHGFPSVKKYMCNFILILNFSMWWTQYFSWKFRKNKHMLWKKIILHLHKSFWLSWILFLLIRFLSVIDIMGHYFLH